MAEEKKGRVDELQKQIDNLKAGKTRDGKLIIEKMERPEPWPEPPADKEDK